MDFSNQLRTLSMPALIIVATVIVSALALMSKPVHRALVLKPVLVTRKGEFYRLFTAGLIHADVTHLLFNGLSFYIFADQLMRHVSEAQFLGLYVSAVVFAFIPTVIRFSDKERYSTLGASGAVAAIMFACIALNPHMKIRLLLPPVPIPGLVFGLGYLLYSIIQSIRAQDNVNHDAHFYGAVYGCGVAYFVNPSQVERSLRLLLAYFQ